MWQFQRNGNTQKVTVKGNIVANDMGVLLKAAKQGMGIAHLPCDLANDHLLSGELIKVLARVYNRWFTYMGSVFIAKFSTKCSASLYRLFSRAVASRYFVI